MSYEVQYNTVDDGWINMWRYPEDDGVMRLETFATADEAKAALAEYFQDLEDELWRGLQPFSRKDFRVHYVPHAHTQPTTKQENHND